MREDQSDRMPDSAELPLLVGAVAGPGVAAATSGVTGPVPDAPTA